MRHRQIERRWRAAATKHARRDDVTTTKVARLHTATLEIEGKIPSHESMWFYETRLLDQHFTDEFVKVIMEEEIWKCVSQVLFACP